MKTFKLTAMMLAPAFLAPIPAYPRVYDSTGKPVTAETIAHEYDRKAHFVTIVEEILKQDSEASRQLLQTTIAEFGGNCTYWAGGAPDHESLPTNDVERRNEILFFFSDKDGRQNPDRHRRLGAAFAIRVATESFERPEFWARLQRSFPSLASIAQIIGAVPDNARATSEVA